MQLIVHLLVTTALVLVIGRVVSGIEVRDAKAAFFGAVGLGLANAFLRPVLVTLTLPLSVLTLGLFVFVLNAVILMLVAAVVDGFDVEDFGSALVGSLLLSALNFVVGVFFGI